MKSKIILLLCFIGIISVQQLNAQKNKKNKDTTVKAVPVINPDTTGIIADSIPYISNRHIMIIDKVIRLVLSDPQFVQAVDAITRYDMLIQHLNKVVVQALEEYNQKNKVLKKK